MVLSYVGTTTPALPLGPPQPFNISAATHLIHTTKRILPLPNIRRADPSPDAPRHGLLSLAGYFLLLFSRVCSVTTIAARPIPEKSVKAKVHRQRHHISEVYVYGGEAESANEWCCCGRVILISRIARLGRGERKNGVTKQHSAKQPHPAASLWPTSPA